MKFSKWALFAGMFSAAIGIANAAQATTGLNGSYYDLGYEPGSVANALADVASFGPPTATFTATTICFPSCGNTIGDGGSTIAQFLGGNAINLSPNSVADLSGHVAVLTGYLDITTGGTYNFALGSDDGSELSDQWRIRGRQ